MTLQLYWSSIGGVEDMVKSGMGEGGGVATMLVVVIHFRVVY